MLLVIVFGVCFGGCLSKCSERFVGYDLCLLLGYQISIRDLNDGHPSVILPDVTTLDQSLGHWLLNF